MHFQLVGGHRALEQGAQLLGVPATAQGAQAAQQLAQAHALHRDEGVFVAPPAVGAGEELHFAAGRKLGLLANLEAPGAAFAGDGLGRLAGCVHGPIVARMGGGFHA